MDEMDYEVVPALAEHVERKMALLEMNPTALAKATGLSLTVLDHVRKGYRKKYQKPLKWKVCRALQWTPDSIDRILNGQDPVDLPAALVKIPPTTPHAVDEVALLRAEVARLRQLVESALRPEPEVPPPPRGKGKPRK